MFLRKIVKSNSFLWLLALISVPIVLFLLGLIQSFDNVDEPLFLLGIFFSLGMAFLYSMKIISSKLVLKSESISVNILIFFISLFVVMFLLPFISIESISEVSSKFWFIFAISSLFYYLGKFFNLKAIEYGEISSVVLLHSITPIVIGIFSFIILKELPTWGGFIGAVIIMFAIYFLKLEKTHTHFLDPIRSLVKDKATIYIIISVFAFAVTTNLDKVGSQLASAYEWVFLSNIFLMIMTIPGCYRHLRKTKLQLRNIRSMYFVALFAVFQLVFQMIAILNILVVYVVTIKVSSIIITVVLGGLLFKEEGLKRKIIFGLFIVGGVVLITLLG